MKSKLALALLVTWRITGSVAMPCQQNQKPNPYLGFCVSPLDVTRSQDFQDKGSAQAWARDLKNQKIDGIKISEVHIYSEEGMK